MEAPFDPYYRPDLALIHHKGFAFHAEACAPGVLSLLEPIRERNGLVLEIGCGSGLLTRRLIDAGHRVIATDASPAMLDLARTVVPEAQDIQLLTLPSDPVPEADAIVGVGHALNYLANAEEIESALVALARSVRPGGILAVDICDLAWGTSHTAGSIGWVDDNWALVTRFSLPTPDRYVREMTTFVRSSDGTWRRDDERHDNVLVDTSTIPALLAKEGVEAKIGTSFGTEELSAGLRTVVGRRPI